MNPRETKATGEHDLFRSKLDQILNMQNQLVKLASKVNWKHLKALCGQGYSDGPKNKAGQPPLPIRLMAGIHILKFTSDPSDEKLCDRWVDYFQFFCGEEFFLHELPFDRSLMTRWCQRMGEAVMFPTDAKLMNRAREKLVKLASSPALFCGRPISRWASSP